MALRVRLARADDAAFMIEMLAVAASWRPGSATPSPEDVLADPDLAHYLAGWPLPDDLGMVAEDDDGPVGSAWLRLFRAADPGYGYVDDATPELSIGVVGPRRGSGIGTMLLSALLAAARDRSVPAVSLSVEPDNPALRLYTRFGFTQVSDTAGTPTLLLRL